MSRTIQVCLNEDDLNMLDKIKKYLENLQEEEFDGRSYMVTRRTGYGRHRSHHIKRKRINDTYAFKKVLDFFWIGNEDKILKSER